VECGQMKNSEKELVEQVKFSVNQFAEEYENELNKFFEKVNRRKDMPKGNYDIFVLALELETVKKRVLKRWGVK
jgi:hypothetical protein|tara:strand:- start:1496 stop:1717 length:222 start_codon:yes stop_codon:yes gene_type:complete